MEGLRVRSWGLDAVSGWCWVWKRVIVDQEEVLGGRSEETAGVRLRRDKWDAKQKVIFSRPSSSRHEAQVTAKLADMRAGRGDRGRSHSCGC
jgi:hypothetical protein